MSKKQKKSKKGEYEMSGDVRRVIPLKNNYCYIVDEKGKLHHLKRDSEEALDLLKSLELLTHGRISRQLTELGWNETVERINK